MVRHYRLDEDSRVEVYGPYTQVNPGDSGGMIRMSLVARTSGDPLDLVGPIRSEILVLDPEQPVDSIRTMSALVADHWARPQMVSRLLRAFASVALLLSAIGLYGARSNNWRSIQICPRRRFSGFTRGSVKWKKSQIEGGTGRKTSSYISRNFGTSPDRVSGWLVELESSRLGEPSLARAKRARELRGRGESSSWTRR